MKVIKNKTYRNKILISFIFVCFLISLVSAPTVGTSDMTQGKVVYTPPPFINYSIITTNQSNYWGSHYYTDYDILNAKADYQFGFNNFNGGGNFTGSYFFGNIDENIGGMSISNDGTKTTFLGKTGDYNRIGDAGNTSHSLNSEDDLMVTGDLEVGGTIYLKVLEALRLSSDESSRIRFFKGANLASVIYTNYFQDQMTIYLGNEVGKQLVFGSSVSWWNDYDHTVQANPTIYMQSATDPNIDNTQWMSLAHNTSNAVIGSGNGSVYIDADLQVNGNQTLGQKIVFAFGEIIDNIVDGWIKITGNLNVIGDVNITGNFLGNQYYGEMWYHNHTGTTLAFDTQNLFYPMYFTNSTELNGFSYVGGFLSSSNLTTQVSGLYKATYRLSGSGQNNHIYFSTVLINGVEQHKCGDHKKMAAGGDIVPMGNSCFIRLSIGDTIAVAVADYTGIGNGDYYSGNLNLVRIGI